MKKWDYDAQNIIELGLSVIVFDAKTNKSVAFAGLKDYFHESPSFIEGLPNI